VLWAATRLPLRSSARLRAYELQEWWWRACSWHSSGWVRDTALHCALPELKRLKARGASHGRVTPGRCFPKAAEQGQLLLRLRSGQETSPTLCQ
jgi:hypothetical protein